MNVQRQVAGLFVVEEKGEHELKGVAEPLSSFFDRSRQRRRPKGWREGVDAVCRPRGGIGPAPSLGPRPRRRRPVCADRRRAGLGKSRLIEEFHSRLGETAHTWVEWNSSAAAAEYAPASSRGMGPARFGGQDVPAESGLPTSKDPRPISSTLGNGAPCSRRLLDIPLPRNRPEIRPRRASTRQLTAMAALLLAGASSQPAVARLRGSALGRSDFTRPLPGAGRTRRASAATRLRHDTARISRALGDAFTP